MSAPRRGAARAPGRTRPGRLQRQLVEALVVHAEQPRHGVGHLRRVHGADQRQVAAGRVGEAGHRAARVGAGLVAHGERGPARPEAQREVARPEAQAQCGGHVVAGSRAHLRSGRGPVPGDSSGGEHLGESPSPSRPRRRSARAAGRSGSATPRVTSSRSPSVPPVGDASPGEPERQPVVRQQHGRGPAQHLGLAAAQPAQLRDGEAGDEHAPAGRGPGCRSSGELRPGGPRCPAPTRCRSRAWPAGGPDPVRAEDDETVLLGGDGECLGAVGRGHAGLGTGGVEGHLPVARLLFAAGRCRRGVRCSPGRHHGTGLGVAHLHLARRRGRVHPEHQGH